MVAQTKTSTSKPKKSPLKEGAVKKRRSPISRAEGERRLIDAAIQLMADNPFSDIGVREIARAADVNHGFIHTWFGSKNDLLLAVLSELCIRVGERSEKSGRTTKIVDPADPETRLIGLLLIRLDIEGVDAWSLLLEQPLVASQGESYRNNWGISPKDSKAALIQGVFIWVSLATFGGLSQVSHADPSFDTDDIIDLWRHMLGLLGKHPRP